MRRGQPPSNSAPRSTRACQQIPSPLWSEPWPHGSLASGVSEPSAERLPQAPRTGSSVPQRATASLPADWALWLPWHLPSLLTPAPRPWLCYQSHRAHAPSAGMGKGGGHSTSEVCREAGGPSVALLQAWCLQEPRSSPSSVSRHLQGVL